MERFCGTLMARHFHYLSQTMSNYSPMAKFLLRFNDGVVSAREVGQVPPVPQVSVRQGPHGNVINYEWRADGKNHLITWMLRGGGWWALRFVDNKLVHPPVGVEREKYCTRRGGKLVDVTQRVGPHRMCVAKYWHSEDGRMHQWFCLLYTSPSPRDLSTSRMPSSA